MINGYTEYKYFEDRGVHAQTQFYGLDMCQNRVAVDALAIMLEDYRPDAIIEIGCGYGGLSVLLSLYCCENGIPYYIYEINGSGIKYFDILKSLGQHIDGGGVFIGDVFSEKYQEDIKKVIAERKRVLVLCDGGNKDREMETFSKFIKSGDIIAKHDYAASDEFFDNEIRGKYWDWRESSMPDCEALAIKPIYETLLKYGAWGAFVKI